MAAPPWSSTGTAAAAQVLASIDQLEMGCELIGPLLLVDDLVVTPSS
jgi:hypothetical protein